MGRIVVVLDNSPSKTAPWMRAAAGAARLALVDNEAVAAAIGPEGEKAILSPDNPGLGSPTEALAPHYRRALETVAAGQERLALDGWGWLVYARPVDACILDFAGWNVEQTARRAEPIKAAIREKAKAAVRSPERILELPVGASDAEKAELASAFLRAI